MDVATGSLGQGICAAIGIALNARRIGSDYRTYCLARRRRIGGRLGLGGRRTSRAMDRLDNLCGITDVNALGQSRATMWQHDLDAVRAPLERVRLARDRRSTATTWTPSSTRTPRRAPPRGVRR